MKITAIRRHTHDHDAAVPLLPSACLKGKPRKWPGEQLERLLTPNEIDQVRRGQL